MTLTLFYFTKPLVILEMLIRIYAETHIIVDFTHCIDLIEQQNNIVQKKEEVCMSIVNRPGPIEFNINSNSMPWPSSQELGV